LIRWDDLVYIASDINSLYDVSAMLEERSFSARQRTGRSLSVCGDIIFA